MNAPLRPLSTAELLDTTFSLYRRHFLLFVGIVAIPYLALLPFQILNTEMHPEGFTFEATAALAAGGLLVLAYAVNAISQGATVVAVSYVYLGRAVTLSDCLSRVKGHILRLFLLIVLMMVVIVIGFLLLVVPGVLLGLMLALAVPVAVLEDKTILKAMFRSAQLTKGSRGRVFLIYVLFFVLMMVVSFILGLPAIVVSVVTAMNSGPLAAPPIWLSILTLVTSFITQSLVGPLMTIAIAVLYYDVRVRKEAFDLQLMMTALDGGGAEAGGRAGA